MVCSGLWGLEARRPGRLCAAPTRSGHDMAALLEHPCWLHGAGADCGAPVVSMPAMKAMPICAGKP
jgi:hypothetical protein